MYSLAIQIQVLVDVNLDAYCFEKKIDVGASFTREHTLYCQIKFGNGYEFPLSRLE